MSIIKLFISDFFFSVPYSHFFCIIFHRQHNVIYKNIFLVSGEHMWWRRGFNNVRQIIFSENQKYIPKAKRMIEWLNEIYHLSYFCEVLCIVYNK